MSVEPIFPIQADDKIWCIAYVEPDLSVPVAAEGPTPVEVFGMVWSCSSDGRGYLRYRTRYHREPYGEDEKRPVGFSTMNGNEAEMRRVCGTMKEVFISFAERLGTQLHFMECEGRDLTTCMEAWKNKNFIHSRRPTAEEIVNMKGVRLDK